jgi:acetyl esterase
MWQWYLPHKDDGELKYAVPMDSDNFSNLPQSYVEVCEMDILRDEGLAYADKMKKAGVKVITYTVPGGYHGYDTDITNAFVQKMMEQRIAFMKDVIGGV